MAADEKTQALKQNLRTYLEQKGIDIKKPFKCLNPAHDDQNPSMSYYDKGNLVKCFPCDATYDLFDLIGIDYGISEFKAKKAKAEALFPTGLNYTRPTNKQPQTQPGKAQEAPMDTAPYLNECAANASKTDYFKSRGISAKTVKAYRLGFDPSKNAITIPTEGTSYILRYLGAGKMRYQAAGSLELFNRQALDQDRPVFITEGAFDALAIIEAGHQATALNSTANYKALIQAVKDAIEAKQDLPRLILWMDNDKAGQDRQKAISAELTGLNAAHSALSAPVQHNDPHDFYMANKVDFTAFLAQKEAAAKLATPEAQDQEKKKLEYEKHSMTSILQLHIINARPDILFPTGFSKLDHLLDGGLPEGLIILGAQSSLGKTTLALQMANQIAQAGKQQALFFSLEQSSRELIYKTISFHSGLSFAEVKRCASDKENDEEKVERFLNASRKIEGYGKNLYIIEGAEDADDIREGIVRHINSTGQAPFVIVDYLQILKGTPGMTDKQSTDYGVTELKRISRQYRIPILAISSLNRGSYQRDISEAAFKESGGIEYSSDILLGLQFSALEKIKTDSQATAYDHEAEKNKATREVQIKILKNRNGISGARINFDYDPAGNKFEEVKTGL